MVVSTNVVTALVRRVGRQVVLVLRVSLWSARAGLVLGIGWQAGCALSVVLVLRTGIWFVLALCTGAWAVCVMRDGDWITWASYGGA